jgi:exodeoxyribonuclease VII large subunit
VNRFFSTEGSLCVLSGDTYPIKERLKLLGCRWDGARKSWVATDSPNIQESLVNLGFTALKIQDISNSPSHSSLPPISLSPSTPFEEKTWSVKELVGLIAQVIQTHVGGSFWVSGEITSLKQSNGHLYFDLAEPEEEITIASSGRASSIGCAFWAGRRKLLAEKTGDLQLSDGLKVRLLIHCEFRRETARVSAIVDDVDIAFTMGSLALNRQAIVRELRKRGLYDRNRDLPLAKLPLKIALVTAADSRAATDFLDELKQSGFSFQLTLFDSHMQGESTSRDVVYSLSQISLTGRKQFDCVVLTRGGGSRLDLRWFDDLEICKAIAHCPLPVITAIGHFEDVSIADEVAWKAEKTPTGAARFLTQNTQDSLADLQQRTDAVARRAQKRVSVERQQLARHEQRLSEGARRRLMMEKRTLAGIEQTLVLLKKSNEKTLERGFALMRDRQGHVITAARFLEANPPQSLILSLKDSKTGTEVELEADIKTIKTGPHKGEKP